MRAIVIDNFGSRAELKLAERPLPVPLRGEVLIRVRAAGVNPVDVKIREGLLRTRLPHQFPIIPGWDVAGVVEEMGGGCRRLQVGDEVYAYARKPVVMHGTYAEFVAVAEKLVALKPSRMSFAEAASVPLAALTAYQSLVDAAGLRRGQSVLIHAAAGGVGGFAVQLARIRGARVIATASAPHHDYVRNLGAQDVIDYTREDFVAAVRRRYLEGVEVAFDTVGGDVQSRSAAAVRKGGILVSLLAFQQEASLQALGIRTRYVFVTPGATQLRRLAAWVDRGVLRTHLAVQLPLEEAARAHELIESRHTQGKIVLVP
jgi:NADPH:quinone reductase-like Zn-dependent oxidoreductase